MLQKKNNIIHNRNLGIELLRMILCFWILSFHCLNKEKISYFIFYITKTKLFHVPCFSFISFYFSYNIFLDRNIIKFKRRIERLLIPYFFWPLLIFIIDNSLHLLFPSQIKTIHFNELKIQLILGRLFMVPLWFLFGSIFLSIILFILSNLFNKFFLFISQLIIISVYCLQYSNKFKYLKILLVNFKLALLDTLSILPLSLLGINFASLNIMNFFKSHLKLSMFFIYLFIFILFKYELFVDLGGYNGIIHIYTSFLFFIGFYILPL